MHALVLKATKHILDILLYDTKATLLLEDIDVEDVEDMLGILDILK